MRIAAVRDTARGYVWLSRTVAHGLKRRVSGHRRHLLLLAWVFPPRISGGVYRPAALARYASRRGWRVTVICEAAPGTIGSAGRHMLDYVGTGVRILPAVAPDWRPSVRAFPSVDGGFLNALEMTEVAVRAVASDPPGVIVASGPPFHSFVAARYIGRAFGAPYVLDYRDEWTECPFGFVEVGNADRYYERACLTGATRVLFTTESHRDHQLQAFPELQGSRCVVIPNGWEPEDMTVRVGAPCSLAPTATRIAFVGALSNHTMPDEFLTTMASVLAREPVLREALRLTFVGQKSEAAERALRAFPFQNLLEVIGEVPRPQAMSIMRHADALLLINQKALERYRPGKLYDYLAMETPILVYGTGGEVARLVRQFDAGCVVRSGDVEELERALRALGELRGQAVKHGIREWLLEHTREKLAGRMVAVLDEIVFPPG